MDHSTPVVILRSSRHGGLGIVRSLGRLGIPVWCVDANWWEPASRSRYCRGRFLMNPPSVDRLREIAGKLPGRPILIPTTDPSTLWVAEHAAELRECYSFPIQDAALVHVLSDKARMQELAARMGVPTARAMVPRSKQEIDQFLETAVFPVVAKAIDADRLRRLAGGTKFVFHTHGELLTLYDKAGDSEDPAFLIQEFIPGEDWMFDGYFDGNSDCLFGITGKKLRRFPMNTGVTSLGICLHNDTVAQTTSRFMKAIGYRGILDIGYRYDQRDGQYKVLDINPRIGCTFRLFTGAEGTDVARALYLDMTGQPVPAAQPVEGRKWLVEDFDLITSLRLMRNRSLKFGDWARSFRGVQETACFALDDPLPFFLMPLANCCELYHRLRREPRVAVPTPMAAPANR
jgi:predicted ATP-grasp superfamily ATP-dependent carboligase